MHELSLGQAIVEEVSERIGDSRVMRVVVEIGARTAVVPDSLRFCFDVCASGTALEGAMLEIVELAGRGHCRSCEQDFLIPGVLAECGCGSLDVAITGGEELRVKEVEVI